MFPFLLVIRHFLKLFRQIIRDDEVKTLLVLTSGLLLVGTTFYTLVEKMTALDALYFSFVTLTTVGYGDFTPVTAAGKIFTMFYILIGLGVVAIFITSFAQAYLKLSKERREGLKNRLSSR